MQVESKGEPVRHLKQFAVLLSLIVVFPLSGYAADEVLLKAKQRLDNGNAIGAAAFAKK